jgi:hypothetical protein
VIALRLDEAESQCAAAAKPPAPLRAEEPAPLTGAVPPPPPHGPGPCRLNYFLGVTSIGLLPYVGASWAGMLPGTFAYVFLGSAGRAAGDAASGGGDGAKWVLYGVGAAATILATRVVSQAAARALADAEAGGEGGSGGGGGS